MCNLVRVSDGVGSSARRSWLPVAIAAAVVVVAVVVGGVAFALSSGGDDPDTVREVADAAVDAAQGLDVDAGIDLLCSAPDSEDRSFLSDAIAAARDATGTQSPKVSYDISNVTGKSEGSFDVRITSSEDALAGVVGSAHVTVSHRGDRSCISGWDDTSIEQGDGEYVVG